LAKLLDLYSIRVVYPIAQLKWIVYREQMLAGNNYRRRSPRHGQWEQIFSELIFIPKIVCHPKFSLEVLLIEEEETRLRDGKGSWRRGGVSIIDRKLISIFGRKLFSSLEDYKMFIPENHLEPFTSSEFSRINNLSLSMTRKMIYCLREIGIIKCIGKISRCNQYIIKK
jgi:hypothetical protein